MVAPGVGSDADWVTGSLRIGDYARRLHRLDGIGETHDMACPGFFDETASAAPRESTGSIEAVWPGSIGIVWDGGFERGRCCGAGSAGFVETWRWLLDEKERGDDYW
jgi:hypothetical protein